MRVIVIGALVMAAGCTSWIRQSAVDAVVSRLQPTDAALVNTLETSGNPTGEGIVVFVKSQSSCAPRYAWLWIGDNALYAVDTASQALTPGLPTLSEAPARMIKRAGADARALRTAHRKMVCRIS